MKEKLILATLVFVLVGCRDHEAASGPTQSPEPAVSNANDTGDTTVAPAIATDCPANAGRTNPLPSLGVPMNVPCGLRSDRTYTTGAGIPRRQVTFEFVDATAEDALSAIHSSMLIGGFRLRDPKDGQSALARNYTKAGYGEVHVWVNPNPGANPKNPAAKGAVGVDFPAPATK